MDSRFFNLLFNFLCDSLSYSCFRKNCRSCERPAHVEITEAISGSRSASLSLASRDRRVLGPPLVERTLCFSLSFSPSALTFDRLEPRLDFGEFAPARLLHKDVVGLQKPLGVVGRGRNRVRFFEEWRCKGKRNFAVDETL